MPTVLVEEDVTDAVRTRWERNRTTHSNIHQEVTRGPSAMLIDFLAPLRRFGFLCSAEVYDGFVIGESVSSRAAKVQLEWMGWCGVVVS